MKVDLRSLLTSRGLKMGDLAERLNINKSSVSHWAQYRVPAERVLEIERLTGVPRHDLRPDLYPPSEAAAQ